VDGARGREGEKDVSGSLGGKDKGKGIKDKTTVIRDRDSWA
jgi:hypothetical protein